MGGILFLFCDTVIIFSNSRTGNPASNWTLCASGNRMVIQDTLICEYVGIRADEGRGKYREWKQYLASGEERVTLLKIDDNKEIYFPPGDAKYYMGDSIDNKSNFIFPNALMIQKDRGITQTEFISADELLTSYGIKLIAWDFTPPIKNSFSAAK